MVTIRFTRMEVQELRIWGNSYKEKQTETGVKWDEDQERLFNKLSIPPQAKASGILEEIL